MIEPIRILRAVCWGGLALALLTVATRSSMAQSADPRAAIDAIAARYRFAGEILVARGDRILLDRGYGTISPTGGAAHQAGQRWRLASITKQVTAALLVRGFADRLDRPIGAPGPGWDTLTLRELLQHHTGLANPCTTDADASGVPSFYLAASPNFRYCASKRPMPGSAFSYNNCDYILAAREHALAWPAGMAMARPGEIGVPGFVDGKAEPRFQLASYGAAGGLMGTARAVFDFDRSLVTGKLLAPASLAELWKPEGNGSYQALGQWVFPGRLQGRAAPRRIVQRDGEIYGVQARNFLLPDDGIVLVLFTNRSSDDFAMGEVWEGKGFVYDLLSAAACG